MLLDVGLSAEPELDTEELTSQLLDFAAVVPVRVEAIFLEQHLAEKVHAYTRTYEASRPSTRTKDLVDMVLVTTLYALDAERLGQRLTDTFDRRATHALPVRLPPPPADWARPYERLAQEVGILAREVATGAW